jgi:hypothetical protein
MNNIEYSIKLKNVHKYVTLLLLLFIVSAVIYLLITRVEGYIFYNLLIALATSFLSSIGLFTRPIEIQVYEKALNFKGILGQEKFIYMKDMVSYEEGIAKTVYLMTKKEKVLSNGFPEISRVIEDIKRYNPYFSKKEIKLM